MHHTEAMTPKFCFSGGFCSTENLVFTNERKELFHDMWDILRHSKITSWKERVVCLHHTGQLGWGEISAPSLPCQVYHSFPVSPGSGRRVLSRRSRGPRVKTINTQARFLFPPPGLGCPLLLSPPCVRQQLCD